mgnify:CR=1 FL=1
MAPFSAVGEIGFQGAAADMGPAPVKPGGQQRQRVDQPVEPFLFNQTADRQQMQRRARLPGPAVGRRGKAGQVQPVIDQVDPVGLGRQVAQMGRAEGGAGRPESGPGRVRAKLFAQFPVGRGPDVLGMGREGPGDAPHYRRIARDRGGRM